MVSQDTAGPPGAASRRLPTSRSGASIYGFEKDGRRQFADEGEEDAALREFCGRLEIPDLVTAGLAAEDRKVLLNFILNHHKVISRYQQLRRRERLWRALFTALSLLLLGGLPYLIFLVGSGGKQSTPELITTQLTALITGLVAVYKSLSSWLDKRKVVGNFRKAEADIKSKLYAFEDKWRGKAVQASNGQGDEAAAARRSVTVDMTRPDGVRADGLKSDFLKEARTAIIEARQIVEEEETKYFDAVTYPAIDLTGMLRETGESARGLVTHQLPFDLEQKRKAREAKALLDDRISEQAATIVRLEAELNARKELIERERMALASGSPEEVAALKTEIDDQGAKVRRLEEELLIAKSQAAALQHSKSAAV